MHIGFLPGVDGLAGEGQVQNVLRPDAQYFGCLAAELDRALPEGAPVLIVMEHDAAKALGILLRSALEGRRKVVCIDGIKVEQGDYVDLGRPVSGGLVIPVVVKTLALGT